MYKIFMISLAVLFLQSCTKCKSFDEVFIDDTIQDYFGMYTQGSYWIYENNYKTKRDSVYVIEYKNEKDKDIMICKIYETTKFKLRSTAHSLLALDSTDIRLTKQNIRFGLNNYPEEMLLFTEEGNNQLDGISLVSDTFVDSRYKTKVLNEITINDKLYTGKIHELYEDSGIYGSVKHLYLQRGIGIVGWSIGEETFNLVKKELQP